MCRPLVILSSSEHIAYLGLHYDSTDSTVSVHQTKPLVTQPSLSNTDFDLIQSDFALEGNQVDAFGQRTEFQTRVVPSTPTRDLDDGEWAEIHQDFARDSMVDAAPARPAVAATPIDMDQVDDYCSWECQ